MSNIFVINPGSTSTKLALYKNTEPVFSESVHHSVDELAQFSTVMDQLDYRFELIQNVFTNKGIDCNDMDAYVGRGGLLNPIPSGTYAVDAEMIQDLTKGVQGQHASNLGGVLAAKFAGICKKPAFIVDPVVVDEFDSVARLSGHPQFKRKSIFHALNHKAVGRKVAESLQKKYEDLNLIIAHLGGGISVAAHKQGRVVDVNNALDGDGPFSPERAGTIPAGDLVRFCFSGELEEKQILKMLTGKGGLVAYTGSNNIQQLLKTSSANDINLAIEAMTYQISKEIAAMAAVLAGNVDAIVLTGGIAFNDEIIVKIEKRIDFIAQVLKFPGEEEMEALALGALRVLTGQEEPKNYAQEAVSYDHNV